MKTQRSCSAAKSQVQVLWVSRVDAGSSKLFWKAWLEKFKQHSYAQRCLFLPISGVIAGYLCGTLLIIRGKASISLGYAVCAERPFVVLIIPSFVMSGSAGYGSPLACRVKTWDWQGGLSFLKQYFDSAFTVLAHCGSKVRAVPLPFTVCEHSIPEDWHSLHPPCSLPLSLSISLTHTHAHSLSFCLSPFNSLVLGDRCQG